MLTEEEKKSLAGNIDKGYIKIWNFLNRFQLKREEREEIAQETMITVWRRLDELQDIGKLDAWMQKIARNKVNDYWRAKKREQMRLAYFTDLLAEAQNERKPDRLFLLASPMHQESELLTSSDVFREVMALGRPANQILLLHDVWKESYHEIAIALSMNPNTVRSIAARSHRKLRRKASLIITSGKKVE